MNPSLRLVPLRYRFITQLCCSHPDQAFWILGDQEQEGEHLILDPRIINDLMIQLPKFLFLFVALFLPDVKGFDPSVPCVPPWRRSSGMVALTHTCMFHASPHGGCIPSHESSVLNSNNEDSTDCLGSVSDVEALLACQAYLIRKRRLRWTAAEERQKRRDKASWDAQEDSSLGLKSTGFFWEDMRQLPYSRSTDRSIDVTDGSDWDEPTVPQVGMAQDLEDEGNLASPYGSDESEIEHWEAVKSMPSTLQSLSMKAVKEDREEDEIHDDFSAIDGNPTLSHLRRSEAAKRRWSDPVWKAKWLEKRWGSSAAKCNIKTTHRMKRVQERVKRLNPGNLLSNPEMLAMSEDDIAEAITTYVKSNRKRVASRKQTMDERKRSLTWDPSFTGNDDNSRVNRETILEKSLAAAIEARARRSQQAKRAYEKRLLNMSNNHKILRNLSIHQDVAASPQEALLRIESDIQSSRLPAINDVQLILNPARLTGRKVMLRRILDECFNLRGKCIPKNYSQTQKHAKRQPDTRDMVFVTTSSIDSLGEFVLDKLEVAYDTEQFASDFMVFSQTETTFN